MSDPDSRSDRQAASLAFAQVETLVDAALDLPPTQRAAWISEHCSGDGDLERSVLNLLDAIDGSEGFLEAGSDDEPAPPPRIGPWQPISRIGRGGMGEVWKARRCDGQFEQLVAIKVFPVPGAGASRGFLAEQRILARLEHSGIARLLDAGIASDGRPYMVMEYIEGVDLIRHCQDQGYDLAARLQLFRQVCAAVAFAHRHLIVHRDLKPQNILVRADGRVALLDFGIARLLDADDGRVPDETIAQFTPRYAAPEQLSGEAQTTLTDVYALGLLLHEVLTGRSPWHELSGAGRLVVLQRVLAGPPPAPSRTPDSVLPSRLLRGDLDAIAGKALRPEPSARYTSVLALDEDIERHLDQHPVRARGDAFGYRLRRGLRRYWLAAAGATVILLGLSLALTAVSLAQRQAERERDSARVEAARGKAVRDYLGHMFRAAGQQQGQGAPLTAKQVLDQAAARIGGEFSGDPALAAQVMQELGELHLYIDDYVGAEPLLRGWLALEAEVDDPVAAATVRFALAETVFRMGQTDEAQTLLDTAQGYWRADLARHGDQLLTSRMLESQLLRRNGDLDAAIATLEAALPERLRRSGTDDFQTAALHTNLGAAYLEAGRLDEGIGASRRALMLWQRLGLDNGNDALNTLNNLAAGYYRAGNLEAAEPWFAQAVELRRSAFGPSAATAALLSNYGRVLLQTGRELRALALAEEAVAMAATHAGERSLPTLAARLLQVDALLTLRRLPEAETALDRMQDDTHAALGDDHLFSARAQLARGQLLAARGDANAAVRQLRQARDRLQRLGPQAQPFLDQVDQVLAGLGSASVAP